MFSLCSKLDKENVNSLVESTRDLCVSKGILMQKKDGQSPTKTYTCVPCSLLPSPIPKDGFQLLTFLQPHINKLIHDVSQDDEFMSAAFKNVIKVDDFTKRLYDIYKASKASGKQRLDFGILRSDYMFEHVVDKSGNKFFNPKQIEVNTIASASVKLGSGLSSVHSDVLQYAKMKELTAHLPKNESLSRVAHGFFTAWKDYGNPNAIILFLCQDNEPNIFDQRAVEYAIYDLDEHITVRRKTCWELIASIALSPDGKLFVDDEEVAIVYFRGLYTADDYTDEKFWDVRLKVEMSRAILCPSIGYQLAGCKKMQEVLAKPDVLERFIDDIDVVQKLRSTFAGFYELEMNSDGDNAVQMAITNPDLYVLKPQREGGGNNIYGEDIVTLLSEIGNDERRCAYILMEKICPKPLDNIFVTASGHQEVQAISELGTFGVILARGKDVIENYFAGHLLRSKSHEHNEGGIGSGLAVLDSPFLV
ncbi:glutathione synthetase-like [Clavelina lepadiformis]|uniref:glutathione synthetase-like n=1 Tax=Clavelina lepadiformis TaxID=159417 RepID=UPI00404107AF